MTLRKSGFEDVGTPRSLSIDSRETFRRRFVVRVQHDFDPSTGAGRVEVCTWHVV